MKVTLYQTKDGCPWELLGYDSFKDAFVSSPDKYYKKVWEREFSKKYDEYPDEKILTAVSNYYNDKKSADKRSLSVSDIVVLEKNGRMKQYYVDIMSYRKVNLFKKKTIEMNSNSNSGHGSRER